VDSAYFTLAELTAAFRLVTDESSASRMATIWKSTFGNCVVGDRVVQLPPEFGLRPLGASASADARACDGTATQDFTDEVNSRLGMTLIRFSDLTLTLLAGSSRDVRARFERLGVPYAYATVDDPELWRSTLEFLRRGSTR
jgi:hypothetical protein